jgi:hypothetical protein
VHSTSRESGRIKKENLLQLPSEGDWYMPNLHFESAAKRNCPSSPDRYGPFCPQEISSQLSRTQDITRPRIRTIELFRVRWWQMSPTYLPVNISTVRDNGRNYGQPIMTIWNVSGKKHTSISCADNTGRNTSRLILKKDLIFLIGIVGGGVQLGPLGNAVTNRPIVPATGDYDDGEICGMIGRGNRSTRRKRAPVPLCPPQTPHAARKRTRVAAMGSQRLTAWATARPI